MYIAKIKIENEEEKKTDEYMNNKINNRINILQNYLKNIKQMRMEHLKRLNNKNNQKER